jgi:DNA polymerase-3 subunit epsilon
MSGELYRNWWNAVWTRILGRAGGLGLVTEDSAVLEIGNPLGIAPWTMLPGLVNPGAALEALDYLSLDTETTGLDPASDCIVSIAILPIAAGAIDLARAFDCLVNPGRPIPPDVVAIHGIDDAMVATAAGFAGIADRILEILAGPVAVGHHIGFDFALLRRETEVAGRQWRDVPALDTMLLASVIWPSLHDLSLDALARRLGVETAGRHTARGDAVITAEVFLRLRPLLRARGILTLGAALAAQELARQALLLKIRSRRWRWRWI